MAEIKKFWIVTDYQGENPAEMWTDPAFTAHKTPEQADEMRLGHYCGALSEGGYGFDQFFHVVFGTGVNRFFDEKPKVYDDAESARKDAQKRFDRDKKRFGPKTADTHLAAKVASRFTG